MSCSVCIDALQLAIRCYRQIAFRHGLVLKNLGEMKGRVRSFNPPVFSTLSPRRLREQEVCIG
ncbi:MAG: hypothetical protein HC769_18275 [Cyanobacteria bacterium CRU_2_1]|nr:hypothetical protein [Cyanobacteria bacterium CRU_2_1]